MIAPRDPYEKKFADFIRMCEEAKSQGADTVVVPHLGVLGDDHGELIESLDRLARAELKLKIAGPVPASGDQPGDK